MNDQQAKGLRLMKEATEALASACSEWSNQSAEHRAAMLYALVSSTVSSLGAVIDDHDKACDWGNEFVLPSLAKILQAHGVY